MLDTTTLQQSIHSRQSRIQTMRGQIDRSADCAALHPLSEVLTTLSTTSWFKLQKKKKDLEKVNKASIPQNPSAAHPPAQSPCQPACPRGTTAGVHGGGGRQVLPLGLGRLRAKAGGCQFLGRSFCLFLILGCWCEVRGGSDIEEG